MTSYGGQMTPERFGRVVKLYRTALKGAISTMRLFYLISAEPVGIRDENRRDAAMLDDRNEYFPPILL